MTRLDWDREAREARLRRHGGVPAWADPAALSPNDARTADRLMLPLQELVAEFALLSETQRQQRATEFRHRFRSLSAEARERARAPDPALAAVVGARIDVVDSALRADKAKPKKPGGLW